MDLNQIFPPPEMEKEGEGKPYKVGLGADREEKKHPWLFLLPIPDSGFVSFPLLPTRFLSVPLETFQACLVRLVRGISIHRTPYIPP